MPEQPSTCKSCHAPIIWAQHVNTGRRAPLDAAPTEAGNCLLDGSLYYLIPASKRAAYPGQLRTNHFATCPDAARYGTK